MVLGANGSFDSFNNFIVRGSPAVGIGRVYDTLLANATTTRRPPCTPHLAQSVDVAAGPS